MFPQIARPLLLLSFAGGAAAEPLKTLAEIRALRSEQAAQNLPVEVEGTVTYFDPGVKNIGDPEGLILHDGTAGCYISSPVKFTERSRIRPGTRIRVKGATNSNSYFPNIRNAKVEVLDQGQLPTPRIIAGRDLFMRSVDADWVEVEAVVVGVELGGQHRRLARRSRWSERRNCDLHRAVTLGFDTTNAGSTQIYSTAIGNVGTSLGISKLGTGSLTLSGNNTFTGLMTFTGACSGNVGMLTLSGDNSAMSGGVTVVPKPGAALLGSLGILALLRRKRN